MVPLRALESGRPRLRCKESTVAEDSDAIDFALRAAPITCARVPAVEWCLWLVQHLYSKDGALHNKRRGVVPPPLDLAPPFRAPRTAGLERGVERSSPAATPSVNYGPLERREVLHILAMAWHNAMSRTPIATLSESGGNTSLQITHLSLHGTLESALAGHHRLLLGSSISPRVPRVVPDNLLILFICSSAVRRTIICRPKV